MLFGPLSVRVVSAKVNADVAYGIGLATMGCEDRK